MKSDHRDDLETGFNQRKQLEIAVETAQKTTGMATRQKSLHFAEIGVSIH